MQQRVAVHRGAHRIHDQRCRQALDGQVPPRLGDGADDLRGRQHARLCRLDPDVLGDGPDLSSHHVDGNFVKGLDAHRVLHGDSGDRHAAVHAE
jgi:hypothetical protein